MRRCKPRLCGCRLPTNTGKTEPRNVVAGAGFGLYLHEQTEILIR